MGSDEASAAQGGLTLDDARRVDRVMAAIEALPGEDVDGNPLVPGTVAPSDVPTEPMTLEEALKSGVISDREELARLLVEQGKVSAEVREVETEEMRAEEKAAMVVYRCSKGHEQHGANETLAKSRLTEQLIARSGPVCVCCWVLWIGKMFPTKPVPFSGEVARANTNRESRSLKAQAEKKRARKKAKQIKARSRGAN